VELFTTEFFAALAAIILIDLVLAGDNAIVIALAARNLPTHLQKRAIVWGTAGAIVVRAAMTAIVVALLKIPGLLLAGGVLLLWIAYRLLAPEEKEGEAHGTPAATFWSAMRTIVIADAVMGLDNVLAVAGAAHGSYLLVVLGLLISIPIVVWGSTLILRWVERFPVIVYLGAGVLALTGAKMVCGEPLIRDALAMHPAIAALLHALFVASVLGAGLLANHRRRETRVLAHVAPPSGVPRRVLIPVDGSRNALHAVRLVAQRVAAAPEVEVHVLNVQPPLSRHVAQFVAPDAREDWHREQAYKALAGARTVLERHGVRFTEHFVVGGKAQSIAREAERLGCDRIVMATARRRSLTRIFDVSVTEQVLDRAAVPVEVVTGETVSVAERVAIPAVLGVLVAVLVATG
jgi:YjbE family integral membrane protein